jgi:arylsulfatase A-like enzyme
MAFNLPHTPQHLPPSNRWRSDWSHIDPQADPRSDSLAYFNMTLETLDVEIERILESIPADVRDNTYVIFMGDNGSGGRTVRPPVVQGRGKGGVYQGGINVPLFVTGPGVAKGSTQALVNSSDMFLTIMEMAGIDPAETVPGHVTLDSVSFMPHLQDPAAASSRDYVYADVFAANFAGVADAEFALRNEEFKLLRDDGTFGFYNLLEDPYESTNLLEGELNEREQAQLDALTSLASELRSGT